MAYQFLDHTADVAFRVDAASPAELFGEAARAFYAVLLAEESRGRVEPRVERTVDIGGIDGEMVLVDFLNELIYLFDAERLLLPHVGVDEARLGGDGPAASELATGGARLRAKLRGEPLDPARHRIATTVKAATYHGLRIATAGGRLSATVVLDL